MTVQGGVLLKLSPEHVSSKSLALGWEEQKPPGPLSFGKSVTLST